MNGKLFGGKVDLLSLLGVGFMVVSLFAIATVAANPLKKQITGAFARYSADALIRQRERTGECKGKYCLAEEVIKNRDNPNNQAPEIQEIINTYDQASNGDPEALKELKEGNINLGNLVESNLQTEQITPTDPTLLDIANSPDGSTNIFIDKQTEELQNIIDSQLNQLTQKSEAERKTVDQTAPTQTTTAPVISEGGNGSVCTFNSDCDSRNCAIATTTRGGGAGKTCQDQSQTATSENFLTNQSLYSSLLSGVTSTSNFLSSFFDLSDIPELQGVGTYGLGGGNNLPTLPQSAVDSPEGFKNYALGTVGSGTFGLVVGGIPLTYGAAPSVLSSPVTLKILGGLGILNFADDLGQGIQCAVTQNPDACALATTVALNPIAGAGIIDDAEQAATGFNSLFNNLGSKLPKLSSDLSQLSERGAGYVIDNNLLEDISLTYQAVSTNPVQNTASDFLESFVDQPVTSLPIRQANNLADQITPSKFNNLTNQAEITSANLTNLDISALSDEEQSLFFQIANKSNIPKEGGVSNPIVQALKTEDKSFLGQVKQTFDYIRGVPNAVVETPAPGFNKGEEISQPPQWMVNLADTLHWNRPAPGIPQAVETGTDLIGPSKIPTDLSGNNLTRQIKQDQVQLLVDTNLPDPKLITQNPIAYENGLQNVIRQNEFDIQIPSNPSPTDLKRTAAQIEQDFVNNYESFLPKDVINYKIALATTDLAEVPSGVIPNTPEDLVASLRSDFEFRIPEDEAAILRARVANLEKEIKRLGYIDPKTGLLNQAGGNEGLRVVIDAARETGGPVSIINIDISGLKKVNDTFGHAVGDKFINEAVDIFRATAKRSSDLIFREVGGEILIFRPNRAGDEFGLVLPGTDEKGAQVLIDRMYAELKSRQAAALSDDVIKYLGFDTGKAQWNGTETMENLLARADAAMYVSKNARKAVQTSTISKITTPLFNDLKLGFRSFVDDLRYNPKNLIPGRTTIGGFTGLALIGTTEYLSETLLGQSFTETLKDTWLNLTDPNFITYNECVETAGKQGKTYSYYFRDNKCDIFSNQGSDNNTLEVKTASSVIDNPDISNMGVNLVVGNTPPSYQLVTFLTQSVNEFMALTTTNPDLIIKTIQESGILSLYPNIEISVYKPGTEVTQANKDTYVLYILAKVQTSEFRDQLNKDAMNFLAPKQDFASWYGNLQTIDGSYRFQVSQCVMWQNLLDKALPDLNIANVQGYDIQNASDVNGKLIKNLESFFYVDGGIQYQMKKDVGDIQAFTFNDIGKIQKGDTCVYGNHMCVILDKYENNGKTYFLISEANSPKGYLDGAPFTYLVDEKGFVNTVGNLDDVIILRSNKSYLDTSLQKPVPLPDELKSGGNSTQIESKKENSLSQFVKGTVGKAKEVGLSTLDKVVGFFENLFGITPNENLTTDTHDTNLSLNETSDTSNQIDQSVPKTADKIEEDKKIVDGANYITYVAEDSGGAKYHTVILDLNSVNFTVDSPMNRETTLDFLKNSGSDIAINGDGYEYYLFYPDPIDRPDFRYYRSSGFTMVEGLPFYDHPETEKSLYFDKDGKIILEKGANGLYKLPNYSERDLPSEVQSAISFPNMLINGGEKIKLDSDVDSQPNSRTALGITNDGKLILLVVDGKQTASGAGLEGISVKEVQNLMVEMGAVIAVNFDGGGSSRMAGIDENGQPIILGTSNENNAQSTHLGIIIGQ